MRTLLPWQIVRVSGSSMTPTLFDADVLLVRHGAGVRAGDIVLATFRVRPGLPVVKRAVAATGDGGWLLASDNPRLGSDSRELGSADVQARAVWAWRRADRRWGRPARLAPPLDFAPPIDP